MALEMLICSNGKKSRFMVMSVIVKGNQKLVDKIINNRKFKSKINKLKLKLTN